MRGVIVSKRSLFFVFLALGAACGFFISNLGSAMAAEAVVKTPHNENSLVVLVDDLSTPQPRLEAIWLVQRNAASGQLAWQPLYPAPLHSGSTYAQPHSEVRVPLAQLAAPTSLAPLSQANVSFTESFVLDFAGLHSLSGQTGALPSAASEPQAALQAQVQSIQSLCAANWQPEQLDSVLALMPLHLQSSNSVFALITRWDVWAANGFGLQCTHPWAN